MEESDHIIETIYQIIFNFYFLIIHTWIIVYLYTWNKYRTIKTIQNQFWKEICRIYESRIVSPFEHPAEEAGVEPIPDLGMFHTR